MDNYFTLRKIKENLAIYNTKSEEETYYRQKKSKSKKNTDLFHMCDLKKRGMGTKAR